MNDAFREHVTSTAFCLQLSKRQCWELLMAAGGNTPWRHNMATLHSLGDRGLVEWTRDEEDRPHFGITRAGEIVVELLKEAGMTAENMMPARYREAA